MTTLQKRPTTFPSLFYKIFEDDFFEPINTSLFNGSYVPMTNISENDTDILIDMSIPGVDKKEIQITMDNDTITVKHEKQKIVEDKTKQLIKEYEHTSFSRSFKIGKNIDVDKIESKMDNGILKIKLPKSEKNMDIKRIDIQ